MYPSVQEAIQIFKSNVQFENENTRRLYFRGLDAFFEYLQDNQLSEIQTTTLEKNVVVQFGGWMKDIRGYSISTRRLYISVLRAALRFWRANYSGWIQFTREEEQEASRTSLIGNPEEQTSRHERLPEDFGNHMLASVMKLTLPEKQLDKLEVLRKRTLVVLLRATALRIGDLCHLTKKHVDDARVQNGRLELRMEKTGRIAHCRLGVDTLQVVDEYLEARDDHSPWILIQHGKSNRRRNNSPSFFKNAKTRIWCPIIQHLSLANCSGSSSSLRIGSREVLYQSACLSTLARQDPDRKRCLSGEYPGCAGSLHTGHHAYHLCP
jgi:site-specific recombinase XerD